MTDRHIHPHLSQRMPQEIIDILDEYAKARGISRTKVVNDAALFYTSSKQCIRCGAMNPAEGKHCAVCGTDLFTYEEVMQAVNDLTEDNRSDYIYRFASWGGGNINNNMLTDFEKAGLKKKYIFRVRPQSDNPPIPAYLLVDLFMYLPGSKVVLSDENGKLFSYSIRSALLIAYLKNDVDAMKKIVEEEKEIMRTMDARK